MLSSIQIKDLSFPLGSRFVNLISWRSEFELQKTVVKAQTYFHLQAYVVQLFCLQGSEDR